MVVEAFSAWSWAAVAGWGLFIASTGDTVTQGLEICCGVRPPVRKRMAKGAAGGEGDEEGEEPAGGGEGEQQGSDDGEPGEGGGPVGKPRERLDCVRIGRAAVMGVTVGGWDYPTMWGLDQLFGRGATWHIRLHQALCKVTTTVLVTDPILIVCCIWLNESMKRCEDGYGVLPCAEWRRRVWEFYPAIFLGYSPFYLKELVLFTVCPTLTQQLIIGRIVALAMKPVTVPLHLWVNHYVNCEQRLYKSVPAQQAEGDDGGGGDAEGVREPAAEGLAAGSH